MGFARKLVTIPLFTSQIDALEVDSQVDQFRIGHLFLVGVANVLSNVPGTFVMLLAAAPDHFLEFVVVLIRMAGRRLEQPLGKIAQMNDETV